jgi:hypothetical protein
MDSADNERDTASARVETGVHGICMDTQMHNSLRDTKNETVSFNET